MLHCNASSTVTKSTVEVRAQESVRGVQGITTRASLDNSHMREQDFAGQVAAKSGGFGGPPINNGRVILAVADAQTVEVFKTAFAQLPASIEVVPCMGPQNVWNTVQQVRRQRVVKRNTITSCER